MALGTKTKEEAVPEGTDIRIFELQIATMPVF